MSDWTILCDFDGTISVEDITDSLLERFGRPGWQDIERAWRHGKIGSRDCMARQIGLLEATRAQIDAYLDTMSTDRAFPRFAAAARAAGIPLTVVSDGLDYAIHRILARHGLDDLPIIANRLEAAGGKGWHLDFPHGKTTCRSGNCKCSRVDAAHAGHHRVLLIGDGASDFCVAGAADFVFAKHRLIEHCRAAAIPYMPIAGFADALDLLPLLIDGEIAAHDHPLPSVPRKQAAAAA